MKHCETSSNIQIVCDFLCLLWSSPMLLPSFSRLVSSWFVSFTSRFEQVLMRCSFHMLLIYKISDGNTTLRCHNLFHFCRRIVSWASLHWSSGVDFRISLGTAEGTGRSRKPLFLAQALRKAVWRSRELLYSIVMLASDVLVKTSAMHRVCYEQNT